MPPKITLAVLLYFVIKILPSNGRQCTFNTMCSCRAGDPHKPNVDTEISCIGVQFSKLPDLPHGNMSSISIVGSGLEVLAADSLGDMKTASLSLMSNNIISVHDHSFMVMYKSLEKLDMSFNNLQDIPIEALLTFQRLKILNLESNEITNLRVPWKHIKESLKSLYLSGNDIYILPLVPDFSLSSFNSLIQIYLDRNFVSSIEANALPYSLQVLSISDNLFNEIPIMLINVLQDLNRLYLKNNYITDIPNIPISNKKELLALDLSFNLIKSVKDFFSKTVQIRDLNLQSNFIEAIGPGSFNGLSCSKLDLSNNEINSLPERAFYGLDNSLEHLNLAHNKLSKIPKSILQLRHIKFISLEYNNLNEGYPDNFLKNCSQSIRSLSLAGNMIKVFPKNIFKPIKKITYLNIGYNLLESVEENDFIKWAENLDTLILAGNSISMLNGGVFQNLKKLVELNLSYNKILKVDDNAFINLGGQIKTLDISFGLRTNEFPEVALKPLNSLIYLALSVNNITSLSRTGIYDLPNLQYLILDFNKISYIPENFFHPKVHKFLKDIRMSFNQISVIDPNTFDGLEDLRYVILNDNNIGLISQESFKNLPNTLTVILSNNHIDKITAMSFVNIPNLVQLDLSNNFLSEFSFNIFQNVTNELQPLRLNLSRNQIENVYVAESLTPLNLKVLDLSFNKLYQVPPNLVITVKDFLRKLDLGNNQIRSIDNNEFNKIQGLEVLSLRNNGLINLKPSSFHGLSHLQILDLSYNLLELLHLGQFKNMNNLRILDLSHNQLRSLPNDAFHNTKLERLIANNNIFVMLPSTPFLDVGYTLRKIDFSYNQIEQIGREVFPSMPLINDVNLCHNKLMHIHNHDFKSVNPLVRLKLCGNNLTTMGRDIFHHTSNLRYLSLAETNLIVIPFLHVPNLVSLNLSHNYISQLTDTSFQGLPKLRHLDLSYNNLTVISGVKWSLTPYLKSIDLSNNPLKILTKDSFSELSNLNHLNLQDLPDMQRFDSDTLSNCKSLRSLKIQTWPKIEKYRFRLARILTNLKHLKELSVKIFEERLTDQLHQAFTRKLQYLEITGENLKHIHENSLEGLEGLKEFHLRITGTRIKNFPKHLFWKIRNNKFTLDLSNNLIEDTDPEVFYIKGGFRRHGTFAYIGNINLQGNPLVCGCNTMWFGKWMKRYLIESLKINANQPEFNQKLEQEAKQVVCSTYDGRLHPVLIYEKNGCHDVLSSGASSFKINIIYVVYLLITSLAMVIFL